MRRDVKRGTVLIPSQVLTPTLSRCPCLSRQTPRTCIASRRLEKPSFSQYLAEKRCAETSSSIFPRTARSDSKTYRSCSTPRPPFSTRAGKRRGNPRCKGTRRKHTADKSEPPSDLPPRDPRAEPRSSRLFWWEAKYVSAPLGSTPRPTGPGCSTI